MTTIAALRNNIEVIREYHDLYNCSERARQLLAQIEASVPGMNEAELNDAFRESIQLIIDLKMLEISHQARRELRRR